MVSRQGRLFPSDGQHGSDQRAGRYCIDKRASVDRTDQLSDRRPIGRTIPLTIPRPPSYDETSFWQEFRRTIHARRADRASTYESA
jgi:hypothetical protein